MLRANGNFQHLRFQLNAMIMVQLDRRRVHMPESLKRRGLHRAGFFQIFARLPGYQRKPPLPHAGGIAAEIQPYAAATQHGFLVYQDIDEGRALLIRLTRIERPLIPLQKDCLKHFFRRIEITVKELAFVASLLIGAHIPGQNLLKRSGQVPAELDGSDTILRFRQVFPHRARPESRAASSRLAGRIHRRLIHARLPAGSHGAAPR